MKHKKRHLNFHDETLDLGNICPACPFVCLIYDIAHVICQCSNAIGKWESNFGHRCIVWAASEKVCWIELLKSSLL